MKISEEKNTVIMAACQGIEKGLNTSVVSMKECSSAWILYRKVGLEIVNACTCVVPLPNYV